MSIVSPLLLSGAQVFPLVEGGKGVGVSNGLTAGAWAKAGGVGTFSGVNADLLDDNGVYVPLVYQGKTRRDRHDEMIAYSIESGISQARRAFDVAGGAGRIHINVLWEMAAVEKVLHGILSRTKGLIHGVTCGAGMPYRLGEIAAQYGVYFYPIVSSGRAFRALWKRAYHKTKDWLGGVVYEDPWLAGGHNGLSNSENPVEPQDPYPRVAALRAVMNEAGLNHVPIVMAGGVWYLRDWKNWINNEELGPIAFQFGTRPLLTQESPISEAWKKKLLTLKPGDVYLNAFSPTGFYSSAVDNAYIKELKGRADRQIVFSVEPKGEHSTPFPIGPRQRLVYLVEGDRDRAQQWMVAGYTETLKTPDSTLIFVTPEKAQEIRQDQVDCMGCLSACKFSNWAQSEEGTTGKKADPRSFCIQKTLQAIIHTDDVETQLMFAGHGAYKFASDPFYAHGHIPTVQELVDRILTGD